MLSNTLTSAILFEERSTINPRQFYKIISNIRELVRSYWQATNFSAMLIDYCKIHLQQRELTLRNYWAICVQLFLKNSSTSIRKIDFNYMNIFVPKIYFSKVDNT